MFFLGTNVGVQLVSVKSCEHLPNNTAIADTDVDSTGASSNSGITYGVACLTTYAGGDLPVWTSNTNGAITDGSQNPHGFYHYLDVANGSVLQIGGAFGSDHEGVYRCCVKDEEENMQLLLIGIYLIGTDEIGKFLFLQRSIYMHGLMEHTRNNILHF